MDEQSSNESNLEATDGNTSEVTELSLKERELALKAREILLKEREAEHKLQLEKKNVWFTSPLSITLCSAILGIVGTAFAAVFQGYSNFQLERQKYEYSIIKQALEVEDKLIEDEDDREESAKKLLFLVRAGIIQSLNSNAVEKLASNPDDLPSYRTSESDRRQYDFYCRIIDNTPTTVMIVPGQLEERPYIKWSSYGNLSAERRCIEVSTRLKRLVNDGSIGYVTHGIMNEKKVICTADKKGSDCKSILFEVKPSDDPDEILRKFLDINITPGLTLFY